MHSKAQDILRKISYIEADLEIQKQILVSIPSDKKTEIEEVIGKIAKFKKEIETLRQTLQQESPQHYDTVRAIEQSIADFQKIIAKKKISSIESLSTNPNCSIHLQGGDTIACLVKACDEQGNWTIVTSTGEIRTISHREVTCQDEQ
ncbi:MAG: hypothetical protein ABR512_11270 [Desulfopila sp.]